VTLKQSGDYVQLGLTGYNVLLQYLGGTSMVERVKDLDATSRKFGDGWNLYTTGKDIEAMWKSISLLPDSLRFELIKVLPGKAGLQSSFIESIISDLKEYEIRTLLYRNEIELTKYRRELYDAGSELKDAAITSDSFELFDSDISKLLWDDSDSIDAGKKKLSDLKELALLCRNVSIVQAQAINHLLKERPEDYKSFMYNNDEICLLEDRQNVRIQNLSSGMLDHEVLQGRLFLYCKEICSHNSDTLDKEVKKLIVNNNPWLTYLKIKHDIREHEWSSMFGELPYIYIGVKCFPDYEEDVFESDIESIDNGKIFDLVNDVKKSISTIDTREDAELDVIGDALTEVSIQLSANQKQTIHMIKNMEETQNKYSEKQRLLLTWNIIISGLIILILFL
jgi:hypothetical protein